MITKEDRELFRQIRKIANIVYEYSTPLVGRESSIPWLEDRRRESVNPFYDQTSSGLFLELYYGQPGCIHTPWGQWNCWGSGSCIAGTWEKLLPNLLKRLDAVEFSPQKQISLGSIGPIYQLRSVDGVALPEAVKRNREDYIPYEQAKADWEELELSTV